VTRELDFTKEVWKYTSDEAREFIELLLERDPKFRTPIPELL